MTEQGHAGTHSPLATLDRLSWHADRVLLDDLVFRIEQQRTESWELGDNCFVLHKTKPIVDQYASFLARREDFRPGNIFELGIWDGGGIAFWFEVLRPRKYVAIDLLDHADSAYFLDWVTSRGAEQSIATYWRTNQADKTRLLEIVRTEFDEPLDLVIDDCSHRYGPTKASFEVLFPLVRSGGLYVIEDWAWSHWQGFGHEDHEWAREPPLTRLVVEILEAAGTSTGLITSIDLYQCFAVVERGESAVDPQQFRLEEHILRRPQDSADDGSEIGFESAQTRTLSQRVRRAFGR